MSISLEEDLDLSSLEDLDFPVPCSIKDHGHSSYCDSGPAKWIAEQTHSCNKKVRPICDKYRSSIESTVSSPDDLVQPGCGCTMPFKEFFNVIGPV